MRAHAEKLAFFVKLTSSDPSTVVITGDDGAAGSLSKKEGKVKQENKEGKVKQEKKEEDSAPAAVKEEPEKKTTRVLGARAFFFVLPFGPGRY